MAAPAEVISVGTTAVFIASGNSIEDPKPVKLKNASGVTIYVGAADVTVAEGYPILDTESEDFFLGPGDSLYAIVASGTAALATWKGRT